MPVELILSIIRLLCPYLRAMADKTESPLDNYIVAMICGLIEVGTEKQPQK